MASGGREPGTVTCGPFVLGVAPGAILAGFDVQRRQITVATLYQHGIVGAPDDLRTLAGREFLAGSGRPSLPTSPTTERLLLHPDLQGFCDFV
jgi:hypothetical protein